MLTVRKLLLASAFTLATSQVLAADLTGTWLVSVQTSNGNGSPTLTLKQTGEAITGSYKGQLGESPVHGTIKGNDLVLTYSVTAQGTNLDIEYTGTVDGTTMSGKVALGAFGEGTFNGNKQ